MLRAAFLVVVLAVANAASFPTNYLADLVISKMEAVTNSTPTSISGFKIISPKPMSWDEADVSAGGFTSVGKIVRTGESKTSMASGKFLLVIPFRMDTVEASFRVTIIQYFSPWFKYSQSVTADHVGEGNLKIQVTTVGGKCKGTFYDLDFNFDDKMMTVAGTPVPNEVSAAKDISDFVTAELAKRYLSLIPSWSKPYVAAVASKALKDINFC